MSFRARIARAGGISLRSTLLLAILLATTLAPALAPPATAGGEVFREDFEDGLGNWTASGAGIAWDCLQGAPGCSAMFTPPCCSTTSSLSRQVDLAFPTDAALVVGFAFWASSAEGDVDTDFTLVLDDGSTMRVHVTDGYSMSNNGLLLQTPHGTSSMGRWSPERAWHHVRIHLSGTDHLARAELLDADGAVVAASATLAIPSTATGVRSIILSAISWGSTVTYGYDALFAIHDTDCLPGYALLEAPVTRGSAPFEATLEPHASDGGAACSITDWTLDFGDGSEPLVGTGHPPASVVHTYSEPGTYVATLTATRSPDGDVYRDELTLSALTDRVQEASGMLLFAQPFVRTSQDRLGFSDTIVPLAEPALGGEHITLAYAGAPGTPAELDLVFRAGRTALATNACHTDGDGGLESCYVPAGTTSVQVRARMGVAVEWSLRYEYFG